MAIGIGSIANLGSQANSAVQSGVANWSQLILAYKQGKAATKALKELEKNRPQRTTDSNILYNQQLAQNTASQGIPQSAKNYYTENVNRGLATGINAIIAGGGDINSIAGLVRGANNEYNKMLAMDSQQKLANQGVLMNANQQVADENMLNWDYNVNIPFQQKYYRAVQQSNAAQQNMGNVFQSNARNANANTTYDYNSILGGMNLGGGSMGYPSRSNGLPQYGQPNNSPNPNPYGGYNQMNLDYQPTMYG